MPREQTARRQAQPGNQSNAITVQESQVQAMTRVAQYVTAKRDQLAMLLAGGVDPERFITVALASVQGSPKLLECSPLSIFTAIREAATYGLELGPLGDASLTPYGGEATLSVEYRGYRKLAMRDGTVRVIAADVVFTNDSFRIISGSEQPAIIHEPAFPERGAVVGAYAWARLENGELVHVEMTEEQLYQRRNSSRSWQTALKYGRADSIWHLWPIEMMRKTVIKRLCSEQLPLTPLLREVITRDTEGDLAQPTASVVQPGQLQGGDAKARIMAAMGLEKPALAPGATETPPPAQDDEDAAAEAYEAAEGDGGAPGASEAPAPAAETTGIELCGSPSTWEDGSTCSKHAGHGLLCSDGQATWDRPSGLARER